MGSRAGSMCTGYDATGVGASLLQPIRCCSSIAPSYCLKELSSDPFVLFSLVAIAVPPPFKYQIRWAQTNHIISLDFIRSTGGPFLRGRFSLSDTAQIRSDDLYFQTNDVTNKKAHPNEHCFRNQGKDVAMNFGRTCISLTLSTLDGRG